MGRAQWWPVVLAFASGAAYEAGCVFWVHYSETDAAVLAVGFSCLNGLVTVLGVESFLRGRLAKLAYVLGFGTGTALALAVRS